MNFHHVITNQLEGRTVMYTRSWALYLSVPFSEESEVRFGQPAFKNGGLLDDKRFFCTNEALTDEITRYLDGADPEDCTASEMADYLLEVFGKQTFCEFSNDEEE